jgi:hypothetical protein
MQARNLPRPTNPPHQIAQVDDLDRAARVHPPLPTMRSIARMRILVSASSAPLPCLFQFPPSPNQNVVLGFPLSFPFPIWTPQQSYFHETHLFCLVRFNISLFLYFEDLG